MYSLIISLAIASKRSRAFVVLSASSVSSCSFRVDDVADSLLRMEVRPSTNQTRTYQPIQFKGPEISLTRLFETHVFALFMGF